MPSYPDDAYLTDLGRFLYAVATLEWYLLGDMPRSGESEELAARAGDPTGVLAMRLRELAERYDDPEWAAYFRTGARLLGEVSGVRNAIVHARPATIDGEQRLHRWSPTREPAFTISADHLAASIAAVEEAIRELLAIRPDLSG